MLQWTWRLVPGSEHTELRERDDVTCRDDEMVEQAYVDERQRLAQRAGKCGIGAARLGGAAGVVVRDDDGACVGVERQLDEFARVDGRLVDGAAKEFVGGEQAVAVVEQQGVKDFVLQPGEPQAQPILDALGIGEKVGFAGGFGSPLA